MPATTGSVNSPFLLHGDECMAATANATVERIDSRDPGPGALPAMLTVDQVAKLLGCSARTVRRLIDSGRIPTPVRLGALVRWPRFR